MRSIIEQGREDAHGNQLHQLRGLPVTAEQKEQRTRNADTEHVDRGENTYTVHHEWATTSSQLIEWEWDMRAKEKQGAGRRRAGDLSWVSLRILVSGRTLGKCLCYPPSKSRPNKHSNSQPASQPASRAGRGSPRSLLYDAWQKCFSSPENCMAWSSFGRGPRQLSPRLSPVEPHVMLRNGSSPSSSPPTSIDLHPYNSSASRDEIRAGETGTGSV